MPAGYTVGTYIPDKDNLFLASHPEIHPLGVFLDGEQVSSGWYREEDHEEMVKVAWRDHNKKIVERQNADIHAPFNKILGWIVGDHRYHAECVHYAVADPEEITAGSVGSDIWNWNCRHCSEQFISDALYHLLFGSPENCECTACMRTSLAAEEHGGAYLYGFRDAAGNFFEEPKEEGWVDDIPVEQWATIYRDKDGYLEGYHDAEDDKYPEEDLPEYMR